MPWFRIVRTVNTMMTGYPLSVRIREDNGNEEPVGRAYSLQEAQTTWDALTHDGIIPMTERPA